MNRDWIDEELTYEKVMEQAGYRIMLVDDPREKSIAVQLRTWGNPAFPPHTGGFADIILRLQFFPDPLKPEQFYLFNWKCYAGGNPQHLDTDGRMRSTANTGATLTPNDGAMLVPWLPKERYYE